MDLKTLGCDDWFQDQARNLLRDGQCLGRVMIVDRGAFIVRTEHGDTAAQLSGKFRFAVDSTPEIPCVGDWVCVDATSPDLAIIHAILPRKSLLRRKSPGKTVDFQMIAANLDVAFVVQACHYDFNIRRLDRYLVAVNEGGIEPIIILSKTDLVTPAELDGLIASIREAGIMAPIMPVSNATGSGVESWREQVVAGRTFCLLGSSGVGKTTLINQFVGPDALETKQVSATGEGVHTTTRRQLLVLDNGAMLIDTPGMRELGLLGAGSAVEENFSDIHDLSLACRFNNCTHTQEPGCAVRAAIDSSDLDEGRHQSYQKLKKETAYHDLSYVEKRKKDRNFGRFIKSVKNSNAKR